MNLKKLLAGIIAFAAIVIAISSCARVGLSASVLMMNSECPVYCGEGIYLSSIFEENGDVIIVVEQENSTLSSLYGGILGLVGNWGLGTFVEDQLLDELKSDPDCRKFLEVCRKADADIVLRFCGQDIRIDSWKL